ncbi:biopolymer transporter ExbD [Halodurantibacterium flavum]|uniref:Biopolymer transporter ExbD n=1 Tax=Halodurantibacterium flavum TaxID=1382802 RepID=A0ABW4S150_9RHOB
MPRLAAPLRRRRLALTSLIDVIFLLLLFFMLSSTFTRYGDMPFMAAASGVMAEPAEPPAFLRVMPDRIVLNVTDLALPDLAAALGALDTPLVLVAPSDDVTAQRLVDVLAAAQGVPGVRLRVIGG